MAKKALLVGVNDYQMAGADLQGCVSDVFDMGAVLAEYCGFGAADIRLLVNNRATKENIRSRLEWLVKDAKKGDVLVFHYSGHGSQIVDRDGDELADHKDEILCPHDMDWDGIYIVDDTLNELFEPAGKSGANLTVIFDCCHSGTGTKSLELGKPERLERFLVPPADIAWRAQSLTGSAKAEARTIGIDPDKQRNILLAGCRADQTSAESVLGGVYRGAFTWCLTRTIREAKGKLTYRELMEKASSLVNQYYDFTQIPQLVGPSEYFDKNIFESV